jgi:hypothetical protein
MNGTVRNRRRPKAVLLLLLICAAPALAEAQQFVCSPIARGDTVSRLARQLTGTPRAAYTHAFQIRDPARQLFVPKSQYRRPLSAGWEACVATEPVSAPVAYAPVVASPASETSAASSLAPREPMITAAPLSAASTPSAPEPTAEPPGSRTGVLVATIASAAAAMMLFYVVAGGLLAPRPVPPDLQRAGEEFVDAFARPLVDSASDAPPIRTRLRFVHRAGQLEISIAPGAGRRYPNLVDHKRNVEYDVKRVLRILGAEVVVSDRLRAAGKWVVVPIRLADQKQTGAK